MNSEKGLNICIIGCDQRTLFLSNRNEFLNKLKRDRLLPTNNKFFFFMWSKKNGLFQDGAFLVRYVKSFLNFQPFLHLLSMLIVPYMIWKNFTKCDVIIVSEPGFIPAAKIASLLLGTKLVMNVSYMPSYSAKTRMFGLIKSVIVSIEESLFYGLVDMFCVISFSVENYLKSKKVPEKKIVHISLDIINRDRVYIDQATGGILRNDFNIGLNSKILLSVGRLESEKNFEELINFFSKLDSSFVLVIAGQGSLRKSLEETAVKLNVSERVIFTGNLGREKIWNYYKDADVFILLSSAEALGLVFWEAMFSRLFVIGSSAPGILESIGENNERGISLKPPFNFDEFHKAVLFATEDSPKKDMIIENAKTYIDNKIKNEENFNSIFERFFTRSHKLSSKNI